MKKFLIASTIAAALVGTTLAAPTQLFAYTDADTSVSVPVGGSAVTDVRIDASRLFDASQLIRLEYGAMDIASSLRIKQVIAPQGVTVSIDSSGLSSVSENEDQSFSGFDNRVLDLSLSVAKSDAVAGAVPVQVILENAMTGQTVTVNVLVSTAQ